MHSTFANINLEKVRRRISEGDCATTPALSVEALEELVVHFADTYHSALPGEHGELVKRRSPHIGIGGCPAMTNDADGEYVHFEALTAQAATIADLRAKNEAREVEIERLREAMEAATVAGWNACRKSIYAVCEDVSDEADRIRIKGPVGTHSEEQHAKGYHAGMHRAAKSIARGFNSMEAEDDDYLAAAIRRLAEGGDRD